MQFCLKSWCKVTGNAGCLLESFQIGRKWDDYKSASQCENSSYKTHATTRFFLSILHYDKVLYELFVITLWITLPILRQCMLFREGDTQLQTYPSQIPSSFSVVILDPTKVKALRSSNKDLGVWITTAPWTAFFNGWDGRAMAPSHGKNISTSKQFNLGNASEPT